MSNYETKADLKNAPGVEKSDFAKKTDLATLKSDVDKLNINELKNTPNGFSSLKSKVDKLDTGKLETTPVDLCDLLKNEVTKKTEYDELVKKVNNMKTFNSSDLVKKS